MEEILRSSNVSGVPGHLYKPNPPWGTAARRSNVQERPGPPMRLPRRKGLGSRLAAASGRACVLLACVTLAVPILPGQIRFRDVAEEAGVRFVLESRPTHARRMIEAVAGGVAAFDADADGLIDIYFTNGADAESLKKQGERHSNRLFRNLGGFNFTDVTDRANAAGHGYSMGVAATDYDNDGDSDLFLAGVRANILYRNDGTGRFDDVTAEAGIGSEHWSVAAGWFDYDKDGYLDLFVVNYLAWDGSDDRFCGDRHRELRIYCSPTYYQGLPNTLYKNLGDGTFEDVSQRSGIAGHVGKGMSVAFADYDADGWLDAFVTNDTEGDFLFRNRGDGTFEEAGLLAGVAFASDGRPISSMGVDFRDYDNDGLPDIHVTALNRQTFPLFRNAGDGLFEDKTAQSGLHRLTVSRSGWANAFIDFDNDGLRDIFVAASHVNDLAEQFENAAYRQPNAVFSNAGDGTFEDISKEVGDFLPAAHRGAAFADFDQDGLTDVVVSVVGGTAELWQNVTQSQNRWLGVRLIGTASNSDGIGARVKVGSQVETVTSSFGYASSSLGPVHFGLGHLPAIRQVQINWPSGIDQTVEVKELDRVMIVREPRAAGL